MNQKHIFTIEDVNACWVYYKEYLVDILNEDYNLITAQEDLLSLINSEWDSRNNI